MPRKRKSISDGYNKAFPKALRSLMDENDCTQQDLANHLGKTRQSVGYYCDGSTSPDWETLAAIAEYFSVSADYLLGLSDDPQRMPAAADELGLSPKAVYYLRTLHELTQIPPYDTRISLLSRLFENRQFDLMLALCGQYIDLMCVDTHLWYSTSAMFTFHIDELKKQGFVISLPDDQARMLFSERIVNLLRSILDGIVEERRSVKSQEGDQS